MADFKKAFEKTIQNEGGYKLETIAGDTGGQTYAGIARNFFPNWEGWILIDKGIHASSELTEMVQDQYRKNFWDIMKGDQIESDIIAATIFDFGVNAGIKTAIKLTQTILKESTDGIMGQKTLQALNAMPSSDFVSAFFICKVARYASICNNNRIQSKFLLGWINRALKGVA